MSDIVEIIIQAGISLKKRGRSFWGLCPFHAERTPSFSVDPQRQRFHCFGCGEGGDAITFVQKLYDLSFKETLKYLNIDRPVKINPKAKTKRDLLKAFQLWRDQYYHELCNQRRTYESMTRDLKTMDQVERFAWIIHELSLVDYRLDILFNGNDEEKYMLFREVTENDII